MGIRKSNLNGECDQIRHHQYGASPSSIYTIICCDNEDFTNTNYGRLFCKINSPQVLITRREYAAQVPRCETLPQTLEVECLYLDALLIFISRLIVHMNSYVKYHFQWPFNSSA